MNLSGKTIPAQSDQCISSGLMIKNQKDVLPAAGEAPRCSWLHYGVARIGCKEFLCRYTRSKRRMKMEGVDFEERKLLQGR